MRMNQLLVQLVECTSIILISINCINCEPIATLASSPRIPSIQGDDVKTNSKLSSVTKAPDSTSVTWSAYNISSHSPVTSGYNISSPSTVTNVTISSTATSPFSFSSSSPSSSSFSPSSASNVSATSSSPASPASSLANHLPPPLSVISSFNAKASRSNCVDGLPTFELVTGFSFVGRSVDVIKTITDMMNLPDCLNACLRLRECKSINFETGLCVLLNTSANYNEATQGSGSAYHQTANGPSNFTTIQGLKMSQFPVFTIYAEKICLEGLKAKTLCSGRAWTFERVIAFKMASHLVKRKRSALNRIQCMEFCLDENSFECRSFNYNRQTGACWLFDVDRQGISSGQVLKRSAWLLQKKSTEFHYDRNFIPSDHETIDYFENNCIRDPKQCDFAPIKNLILKTVDSVHENVRSFEACKAKCLNASYRCFSFDFGADSDPKNNGICRTSHLNTGSVVTIESPFAEMAGAVTYQLVSCLNVTVECNGMEMIARIKTNRVFNGKIYAKSKPNSCVNDVTSSLDFSLTLPYNDVMCDVKNELGGNIFSSQLVIQHHDLIVTQADFGASVVCRFDLKNRTISNGPAINVDGSSAYQSGHEAMIEATSIKSPNVTMRIADVEGNAITSAKVGDTLNLHFDIIDTGTPYEIFVRDLVAVDGIDTNEIQLIDSTGCPTEMAIMTSVAKFAKSGKRLRTTFEAFKFPSSNTVQFRALITPCLSSCKPVQCNLLNTETGINQEFISYGRRKRSPRDIESHDKVLSSFSTQDNRVRDAGETNSPVIEPLNNHYTSVASSDQVNYRGNSQSILANDDLVKDGISNSNSNDNHHRMRDHQEYTYTDQLQSSTSSVESVTQYDTIIDPKSQVVVVGAIKISDSFDFTANNDGSSNDATVRDGKSSGSLSRKSLSNNDVRSNGYFSSSAASGDCVNIVTVIITCIIFFLGQLIIIFAWYYMYKKIQMYQWLSGTLFPGKNLSKSTRSSSISTLETCSAASDSVYHSPSPGKCLQGASLIQNIHSPSPPPAPVRVFRTRYPFQSSADFNNKSTCNSPHSQLPIACYHQT